MGGDPARLRVHLGAAADAAELPADPQVVANGYVQQFDHPDARPVPRLRQPGAVRRRSRRRCAAPPQELGAETEEVLLELGYTWDDIAALKEAGVIC